MSTITNVLVGNSTYFDKTAKIGTIKYLNI